MPKIKASNTKDTSSSQIPEEFKDINQIGNLNRFELYHDECKVVEKIVRVKRVSMPNNGDKWKVFIDNKVVFTIESPKISKKEREYLKTIDGFNFILGQAKLGIKSLNSFRVLLKKNMEKAAPKKKRGRPPKIK